MSPTSQKRAATGRLNLIVTVGATLAIAVLLNVLVADVRIRMDLTDNAINALSPASREAVAALPGLEVRVYVSPDLPASVSSGAGAEVKLQGLPQRLADKLAEYAAYAPDMTITVVTEDLVGEAERNRLQTFSGKGGSLSDAGQFEFRQHALGLSFHYKNQTEVFELALQPEYYEFEITRRLLRLKDKAEFALTLKDMLDAAHTLADGVRGCTRALKAVNADEGSMNPLALADGADLTQRLGALKAAAPAIRSACDGLFAAIEAARAVKSDVSAYARLIHAAEGLAKESVAFTDAVTRPEPPQAASLITALRQIVTYGESIDRDVQAVEDAPGQRRIGFVCHAEAFCPFPDPRPLIPKEIADGVASQPGLMGRVVAYLQELEQEVANTLKQINGNVFRGRGFEIVKVDLDQAFPDDLTALVVYGPTADFSEWQLWRLDQFLLRGGSLVAFLNPWDVRLQPIGETGQLEEARMVKETSNLNAFLTHFGLAPTGALVVEPDRYGEVRLTQFLPQEPQMVPLQHVAIPYPMLPTFSDMELANPLVRATPTLTLPFTTWFELKTPSGVEVVSLVRSSKAAASIASADFPLDPGQQLEATRAAPAGIAMPVVVLATGEFTSYFKGQPIPPAPATAATATETPRADAGRGRILAVGSNLGLTSLDREVIFPGFAAAELSQLDGAIVTKAESFRANFATWSSRVDQVRDTLRGNIQFLQNTLDWAVQREAIAELRSKQHAERPLALTDSAQRRLYRILALAISPALLLIFGLLWALRRRARQRRFSA